MKKNLLVYLQGGEGYHAAFAQILPEAKQYYDKIYVCSAYADIFKQSPYVEYVYEPQDGAAAFQDLDIDDTFVATGRVYDYSDFIHKELNYSDAFRRWIGIPEKHEELSSTKMVVKDNEQFQTIADQIEDHIFHKLKDKKYKNFIIFQSTGGQSALSDTNQPYDNRQQPLRRYMSAELANGFISLMRKAHPETAIITYQLPNEPRYAGTEQFVVPYLTYTYLAKSKKCKGVVSIDSSLQHITAGITPAVILYYHTVPECFGYIHNINIMQNCKRDDIRFFTILGRASNKVDEIKPEVLMKIVEDNIYGEFKPGIIKTDVEGEIVE